MMKKLLWPGMFALVMLAVPLASTAVPPKALTVYAAGTLAMPFQRINEAFEKLHPDLVVKAQFAGSVMMARRIADLGQSADVYAAADYAVIPKILGKAGLTSWFIGFSSNAVTLAYTPRSRGAAEINAQNWYRILSQPGVVIGRSDPNTDPSGYQFLQMLSLASIYYHEPELKQTVLKNSPKEAMRDTETSLTAALQLGQIDYLAIYTATADSHGLRHVRLPADIDLSDPAKSRLYAQGSALTDKGVLKGKPIIYAVTIPASAKNPELAAEYIRFLLGPQGRKILEDTGFSPLDQPWVHGLSTLPDALKPGTRAWPSDLAVGE